MVASKTFQGRHPYRFYTRHTTVLWYPTALLVPASRFQERARDRLVDQHILITASRNAVDGNPCSLNRICGIIDIHRVVIPIWLEHVTRASMLNRICGIIDIHRVVIPIWLEHVTRAGMQRRAWIPAFTQPARWRQFPIHECDDHQSSPLVPLRVIKNTTHHIRVTLHTERTIHHHKRRIVLSIRGRRNASMPRGASRHPPRPVLRCHVPYKRVSVGHHIRLLREIDYN